MNEKDPIDDFLEKVARINGLVNPPQKELPPALLAQCKAIIASPSGLIECPESHSGGTDNGIGRTVVSVPQMRLIILKLIEKCPRDGPAIVATLKGQKISLNEAGDLLIYALFYELESEGLLYRRRRVESMEIVTAYHITSDGDAMLKRNDTLIALPLPLFAT